MATKDIKSFLFEKTNIAEKQWKRISKKTLPNGDEVRIFQDKISGLIIETIETTQGDISIQNKSPLDESLIKGDISSNEGSNVALSIIKKHYEYQSIEQDIETAEYQLIPSFFKFCFLEDSNPDHQTALIEGAKTLNRQLPVTGFNLFFRPTFRDTSCIHLEPLLKPFLPSFLEEIEESCFAIYSETMGIYDDERLEQIEQGVIPNIPYDRLIATLEQKGFTYDIKHCLLSPLGGSKKAKPF